MVANAPFVGTQDIVVLYAVTFKESPAAIVHFNRAVNHDLIFRLCEHQLEAMRDFKRTSGFQYGAYGAEVEILIVVNFFEFGEDFACRLAGGAIARFHLLIVGWL